MRIRGVVILISAGAAVLAAGCGGRAPAERAGLAARMPTALSAQARAGALGDACALARGDAVAAAFGARVGRRQRARFPGTCSYRLLGGVASGVVVSLLGPPSAWDGVREGYVRTRGGARRVAGVGEAAFQPPDAHGLEIVVRTRATIFAVAALRRDGRRAPRRNVRQLARVISRAQARP